MTNDNHVNRLRKRMAQVGVDNLSDKKSAKKYPYSMDVIFTVRLYIGSSNLDEFLKFCLNKGKDPVWLISNYIQNGYNAMDIMEDIRNHKVW